MKPKQRTPDGFAAGGSFTYPHALVITSSLVAFLVTPGERVVVETPFERQDREQEPQK